MGHRAMFFAYVCYRFVQRLRRGSHSSVSFMIGSQGSNGSRGFPNEDGFDVNVECRKLDSDILLEAQDEHDRRVSDVPPRKNDREKDWSYNKDWSSNKDWHGGKNSGSKGGGKSSKDKRKGSGQWESADKRGRW